jgi:hypothetical protein
MDDGIPKTRYAETLDGVDVAYQVLAGGPPVIVYVSPGFSRLETARSRPSEGDCAPVDAVSRALRERFKQRAL